VEISIPINNHYYDAEAWNEADLKKRFQIQNEEQFKVILGKFFSSVYELNTASSRLSKLQIFSLNNNRFNRKDKDKLILKLYSKNQNSLEKQYFIQTGLFAGVIYYNGCKFNITINYGSVFLRRMLNFVNDIFIDNEKSPSSSESKEKDFEYIIAYLFIQSLEKASLLGLPQEYKTQNQRSHKVRGKINLNAYLKSDIPFQGKLSTTYREQVYIQEIIDVIYLACKKLESKYGKDIHNKLMNVSQVLKQHYSGRYASPYTIQKAKNHRVLQNSMYIHFKKVLEYAEVILLDLDLSPLKDSSTLEVTGFLFDVSELFEVYLEKLLSNHFKEWQVSSQEELKVYNKMFYKRYMLPDIVMRHGESGKTAVFDAKLKNMVMWKEDLDREDFFQIHTYIQYYKPNIIAGGLIYPFSNQINLEKSHSTNLFGNPDVNETKFIVDGVQVWNEMSMTDLVKKENEFLKRIEKVLDYEVEGKVF
jgi:5-methylcytosine-specific restriction enzyme subunit McrC